MSVFRQSLGGDYKGGALHTAPLHICSISSLLLTGIHTQIQIQTHTCSLFSVLNGNRLSPSRSHTSSHTYTLALSLAHRLVGLVVRRPPRERKIPGSNPACAGFFSGSSHSSDSKIGTPVSTLPNAWRYRVSAETGWPGVSIL